MLKTFKPSIGFKISGLLFISFLWFAYLFGIYKTTNINGAEAIVVLFVILFITVNIFHQLFDDEAYNFTIYIDKEGIQIDYELFSWNDIKETAIINFPTRGKGTDYLVINYPKRRHLREVRFKQFYNVSPN